MLICDHNDGVGHCDINVHGEYCVEGPCPYELLIEYAPVVRCVDCEYYSFTCERKNIADAKKYDFCSRGVRAKVVRFVGAKMDGGAEDVDKR